MKDYTKNIKCKLFTVFIDFGFMNAQCLKMNME